MEMLYHSTLVPLAERSLTKDPKQGVWLVEPVGIEGRGFIVNEWVELLQPVNELVKVNATLPLLIPETMPLSESTIATELLLLVQVPLVLGLRVVVVEVQITESPVIETTGNALIVSAEVPLVFTVL